MRASMTGRITGATTGRTLVLSGLGMIAVTRSASAAGMPQLQFNNPLTLWQVFWGAVIFLVLYLLLSRSALPRVESVLAERRGRIDGDLDAAKAARREADKTIEELRLARREATAEASGIVDKVVADAREQAATRIREMNQRLEAEIAQAELAVSAARQTALGSLRTIASDTAQLLVERLTGAGTDHALVEAKVDTALAARPA